MALLLALWLLPAPASAQGPNQAALVVDFGDGRVESQCLSFTEASITGADLLARSGLEVQMGTGAVGVQVCKISDTGCDVTQGKTCFCQCVGVECHYWTYFHWRDGVWAYSSVGAALRQLSDGDADAWVWGDGKTLPQSQPGACAAGQAAPTATPAGATPLPPTETPTPLASFTPTATATAEATATATGMATAAALAEGGATATTAPATPTAAPTAEPSVSPTSIPSIPSITPTLAAAATTLPTATATPVPQAGGRGIGGYLGWVALVAVGGALAVLALRRR